MNLFIIWLYFYHVKFCLFFILKKAKIGYLIIILGFECCVQYQHNECNCSYSCKFVKEYFEDSKELTNEEMKQLSSEWSERRRLSLVEKEKRKEEEAEAQKEMWRRVQEMMNDD